MSELQSFNDPLLAEWLGAVERDMGWAVNASPVLLAKGLSDGSLRETWKRKESRLPKIDQARHQMWAQELLELADRRVQAEGHYRVVRRSVAHSVVGQPSSVISITRGMTAGQMVATSIALVDSALARTVHCHVLMAQDDHTNAMRVSRQLLSCSQSASLSKCLLQVLGIVAVHDSRHEDAFEYYLEADVIARNAGEAGDGLATSRFNLLACALHLGSSQRARRAIELLNDLEGLSNDYHRELIRRTLEAPRAEYTIDEQLRQTLDSSMSQQTRELIHEAC